MPPNLRIDGDLGPRARQMVKAAAGRWGAPKVEEGLALGRFAKVGAICKRGVLQGISVHRCARPSDRCSGPRTNQRRRLMSKKTARYMRQLTIWAGTPLVKTSVNPSMKTPGRAQNRNRVPKRPAHHGRRPVNQRVRSKSRLSGSRRRRRVRVNGTAQSDQTTGVTH